jgi:outer membrane protein TolC
MQNRVKSFLIYSAVVVLCGVVLSYGTLSQPETGKSTSANISGNDEIVQLYKELIALRQQAVEQSRRLIELGQGSLMEQAGAETKAAEARIELARFQGNKEAAVEELQNLVQTLTEIRNSLRRDVETGQLSQSWTYEIDGSLLETKIRLAKMKLE